MGIGKHRITEANREYCFHTYANKVTRAHWRSSVFIAACLMVMAVVDVRLFLQLSYIQRAGQQLLDTDVKDWIDSQLSGVWGILALIFAVIFAMTALLLLNYWLRVKSYDLYKKRRRYIAIVVVLAVSEIAAACVVTGFLSHSRMIVAAEAVTLLGVFLPMLSGARLLIPWEVIPLRKTDVNGFLKVMSFIFDWFSAHYLDKE